ncbi:VOC family protein [Arthrobacter sp. fls2-241-R2A-200]|uniref:VOC family protein n=2 Tax=Bacillati TaxID=1783272 RepID=UPI002550F188|nr:VOC family protein [Arthrobacter sp. fls2-241-R2A-200]
MALNIQVVVDCKDPHALADWWAETLQWQVEPQSESTIRSMIEQGFATEDQATTHKGKLVWADGCAIVPAGELGQKEGRRILFQVDAAEKSVKNRVHWDVRLDGRDKDAVRKQLEDRGATYLWTARQGPHEWHTMADPEGNEFCIS